MYKHAVFKKARTEARQKAVEARQKAKAESSEEGAAV